MGTSPINSTVVSVLPFVPKPLVWRFSRRYIAGTSLDDALRVIEALNAKGIAATIDVLGEDSHDVEAVSRARDLYLAALDRISARKLDCNISVKLSEMGVRFDESLCRQVMAQLITAAEEHDNFVRIDMEDSSVTQTTLDLYRSLRTQHARVGAVLQSCLRRSEADVRDLLEANAAHVRLCKGIYLEPENIAYQEPEEINASYRLLLETLLRGKAERVGIATHHPALIEHAEHLIRTLGVPRERYEFQMLLGVAENLRDRLVADGHPMRVYVPFGELWFAYSRRRLKENPQIAGHIIRNLFRRR